MVSTWRAAPNARESVSSTAFHLPSRFSVLLEDPSAVSSASVNDPDGRRIWLDLDLVEVP